MRKPIRMKEGSGQGVTCSHKLGYKQWRSFLHEEHMLKTFKQLIINKDAVYHFEQY